MAASDYVPNFLKNRLHLAGRPQMSTPPNHGGVRFQRGSSTYQLGRFDWRANCQISKIDLVGPKLYRVHSRCRSKDSMFVGGPLEGKKVFEVWQQSKMKLRWRELEPPEPRVSEPSTARFCVSVTKPAPEVVKDPEYNEDKWLALREGPGPQFNLITKLGGFEHLEADATKGDWTHISNVPRLSSTEKNSPQVVRGWVRSKYVKKFPCESETAGEPKSDAIRPEEKDAEWCRNHDHKDAACVAEADPNNPGFSKPKFGP